MRYKYNLGSQVNQVLQAALPFSIPMEQWASKDTLRIQQFYSTTVTLDQVRGYSAENEEKRRIRDAS